MITHVWSDESPLWRLLLPLSWLYGLVSGAIHLCYRLGLKHAWHAPTPIVMVGNLAAGENGKAPVMIWLVEQLQQRGIRVGVVSRSYGEKMTTYPLLLAADTATAKAGDEPMLVTRCTGVPVAVSSVRSDMVRAILAQHDVQTIVTDDGLQHYRLARGVGIIAIDGERRFGNGWWLPAGPMREHADHLKSVDVTIVNGGIAQPEKIPMQLGPGLVINLRTGEHRDVARSSNIVAMVDIGRPPRFFATLEAYSAGVQKSITLADHQPLTYNDASAFADAGQTLVVTEKDTVKCRTFADENW